MATKTKAAGKTAGAGGTTKAGGAKSAAKAGSGRGATAAKRAESKPAASAKKAPAKRAVTAKAAGAAATAKQAPARKAAAKSAGLTKGSVTKTAARKKPAAKGGAAKKGSASLAQGKDPKGGLTAEGRRYFKEKEGLNLRPGVKGKADTPEKMVRKGSFLRRHFANPPGPVKDKKGEPTRQALQATAWGEPVPQNEGDEKKLAAKGSELLEKYHAIQDGAKAGTKAGTKTGKKGASAKRVGKKG